MVMPTVWQWYMASTPHIMHDLSGMMDCGIVSVVHELHSIITMHTTGLLEVRYHT